MPHSQHDVIVRAGRLSSLEVRHAYFDPAHSATFENCLRVGEIAAADLQYGTQLFTEQLRQHVDLGTRQFQCRPHMTREHHFDYRGQHSAIRPIVVGGYQVFFAKLLNRLEKMLE